jgi:hypothetical protein
MVERTDFFLSYAWKDDPDFVKHLDRDLTAAGHKVWWDRVRMGDRVVPLNQQVRDAVSDTGRLIVVMGPAAAGSPAVRAEWNYALSTCKPVIAILRIGEYAEMPEELRKFYCPDFRKTRPYKEALAELLRILKGLSSCWATCSGWDLEADTLVATFTCDSPAYCCACAGPRRIVAGDQTGRVHFLSLELARDY